MNIDLDDLSDVSEEDLAALRTAVLAEINARSVLAQAEAEAVAVAKRFRKAKNRNVPKGQHPAWKQPTGAADFYTLNDVVDHAGKTWRSDVAVNTWEPGVAGWTEEPPEGGGPVAWVRPVGSTGLYQIGDEATHNGATWTSTVPNNVWEPGVYGWTQNPE